MSVSTKPALRTPTTSGSGAASSPLNRSAGQQFIVMALNMSWQLAIAVIVPIVGGVYADKAAGTKHVFLFIGLVVAAAAMAAVLWRTLQAANTLPVPKLTAEQKRAVQKSYEEDDD